MTGFIVALFLAAISGVAMAVQGSINSALGKTVGLWQAVLIVHFTATLIVGIIVLSFCLGDAGWTKLNQVPWYFYLGGLIGVLITYGVVASIPKVGVALATTAIIVGQVSTALLVDHFGFFGLEKIPITWVKLLGLILLAAGARLMLN